jgi:hypothetical protein
MLTSVRLDEKSPSSGALASWRGRLHVLWADPRTKLQLTSSPDGRIFDDPHRFPHSVFSYDNSSSDDSFSDLIVTAPALAAAPDALHLAWTSGDFVPHLFVAGSQDGFAPAKLAERSHSSPAISVSDRGAPVLAWTGTDRHVNVLTLSERRPPIRLKQAKSSFAPALCGHRGSMVLAWTGTDRRVNLLTLSETRLGSHLRLEEARTVCAPAVCSHQGTLVLAWTGTDRRVNLVKVSENRRTSPLRLDQARSLLAPAVCSHHGDLVVAWTGTDSHLNVGFLVTG